MSSISVRFNSFLFLYSIFNERKLPQRAVKSEKRRVKSVGWKPLAGFFLFFSLLSLISSLADFVGWSVWMDSNHRPHAYQACALATWATDRFFLRLFSSSISSRISPWWWRWWDSNPWPPACRAGALPTELHPHFIGCSSGYSDWSLTIEQQKLSVLTNTHCLVILS